MNLFTEVTIPKSSIKIDYQKKLMFVGSCFADNISALFANVKFNCLSNPIGTLYNPLSINLLIDMLYNNKDIEESDFFYFQNQYSSYLLHSCCSHPNLNIAIEQTNNALKNARNFLKNSNILFITLGTAFVYYLNENNMPVANCHKQDAKLFTRRLLSVEQSVLALDSICEKVIKINPEIKIVLTVSPIRHIADGVINNTLSKSTLLLSVNQIVNKYSQVEYFPSYEIMIDQLRDYRFYNDDLTHPSPLAEKIIFEKLLNTYCSPLVIRQIDSVEKFIKSVNHKIIAPKSDLAQNFAKKQIESAMQLEAQIVGLNLKYEKLYFSKIINYD